MPVNSFNVGRDVSFNIYDTNSQSIVSFSIVTGIDRKAEMSEVKVKGIDGIVRHAFIPDGWRGTIEVDRADASVDNWFAYLEELYFSGRNVLGGNIQETITEVDGSISQWIYDRVAFKLTDAGAFKGDSAVKMKIEFAGSRRRRVQ